VRPRVVTLLAAVLVTAVLPACSGNDGGGTGAQGSSGDIQFVEGEIPEQVPDDFPMPPDTVIGTSFSAPGGTYAEVVLRVRSELEDLVIYYEGNLKNHGWAVTRSEMDGDQWEMDFTRDGDPDGAIRMTLGAPGVTQAIVTFGEM
jgi:hypothetical protein